MATAFHDKTEIVGPSEVNSGNDIGCGLRCDRINTGTGRPSIDPAGGLGRTWLITDVERILQIFQYFLASGTVCGSGVSGQG